jgi:hypothetical protein
LATLKTGTSKPHFNIKGRQPIVNVNHFVQVRASERKVQAQIDENNLSGAFVKSDPNDDETLSMMPPPLEAAGSASLCLELCNTSVEACAAGENMEEKGEPSLDITDL